jgi:hypothetical protein
MRVGNKKLINLRRTKPGDEDCIAAGFSPATKKNTY